MSFTTCITTTIVEVSFLYDDEIIITYCWLLFVDTESAGMIFIMIFICVVSDGNANLMRYRGRRFCIVDGCCT